MHDRNRLCAAPSSFLLEVRPEYLESAFAAIDERYGSFTAYLYEGLGLNDETLDRLRLAMLD